MKVIFRAWRQGYTEIQSEGDTLYRLVKVAGQK